MWDTADHAGDVVLEDVYVFNGFALYEGGCVWVGNSAELRIRDSMLHDCHAQTTIGSDGNGGAIFAGHTNLIVADTSIRNGKADTLGGGIYATTWGQGTTDVTITSSVIELSDALNGGAIAAGGDTSVRIVNDSSLRDNEADELGGGIFVDESITSVEVVDSHINNNTAQKGGGIYIRNGTTTLLGADVSFNIAEEDGGGAFVRNGRLHVQAFSSSTEISDNLAVKGGGIAADGIDTSAEVLVEGSLEMARNQASLDGGAIFGRASEIVFAPGPDDAIWLTANQADRNGGGVAVVETVFDVLASPEDSGTVLIGSTLDALGDADPTQANVAYLLGGGVHARDVLALMGTPGSQLEFYGPDWNVKPLCADLDACSTIGGVRVVGNIANVANGPGAVGAGIHPRNSDFTANNVVIAQNSTHMGTSGLGAGGGLAVDGPNATADLVDTTISRNTARAGGGLFLRDGATVTVRGSYDHPEPESACPGRLFNEVAPTNQLLDRYCAEIAHNDAYRAGGILLADESSFIGRFMSVYGNVTVDVGAAMSLADASSATLESALIARNYSGGADFVGVEDTATLSLVQSTVARNGGKAVHVGPSTVANVNASIVWGGSPVFSIDPGGIVQGACNDTTLPSQITGPGNVGVDPLFNPPAPLPQARTEFIPTSPMVIDTCAGGVDFDILARPRPLNGSYDMGAYEQ